MWESAHEALIMTLRVYTTVEVAHMTGFTVRQLDYWAREGIVVPSIQQSHGPGTRRLYSFDDLVQLRFIRRLKHHRWSTQKIRRAIAKLREVMGHPDPLKQAVLVHSQKTILAICKTKEGERILLDTLDPGGQQVMWVVLDALEAETRSVMSYQADERVFESTEAMVPPGERL